MILLLAAIAMLQSPLSGDGIEPLTLAKDRACTDDGTQCVGLTQQTRDGEPVFTPVVRAPDALPAAPQGASGEVEIYKPWNGLIRLSDGGFLAGVEMESRSMYSGGGGQATELRLYRLDADGDTGAAPVLTVPIQGSLMIRACFSEEDMTQRAGACHDEYSFAATLTASDAADAMPVLTYETTATAYPRGASRSEDSLEKPPLKPVDLIAARDPKCSFSRRFAFDAKTGEYQPDSPLPDCSDYTVP
ncbi:hypothetical protein [Brevundimonas vesicularis]|uniref:hypothetical protein n=1 Tax=Brevundimonas vesicularis TaxID=41276 RepID=UPI0022ABDE13|nr:hypothetical protein [Brevundimonas vesicularis]